MSKERLASETIFSGKTTVIALCDVSTIHKLVPLPDYPVRIFVKSKNDPIGQDGNSEPTYLYNDEATAFMRAWCDLRSEIDPTKTGPEHNGPDA